MGRLLRTVRENRWYKDPAAPYLGRGDTPADPLGDVATNQNCLSVWRVADGGPSIERLVRAVAVGRDKIDNMGYVVFDEDILGPLNIPTNPKPGQTPDTFANEWHLDLTELSGLKIVGLVRAVLASDRTQTGTVLKKKMLALVEEGIREDQLRDKEKLEEKLARSRSTNASKQTEFDPTSGDTRRGEVT